MLADDVVLWALVALLLTGASFSLRALWLAFGSQHAPGPEPPPRVVHPIVQQTHQRLAQRHLAFREALPEPAPAQAPSTALVCPRCGSRHVTVPYYPATECSDCHEAWMQ